MSAEIHYGKSGVTVYRAKDDGTLFSAEVSIDVRGQGFLAAYTEGDNSRVVATDTMKNFVWAMAAEYPGASLEGFAAFLAVRFAGEWEQLDHLRVRCVEIPFRVEARVLRSAAGGDRGIGEVELDRTRGILDVRGGREGLDLLKPTGSSFTRFVRDAYTTLPEIVDRPLWIGLDAHWRYADPRAALDGGSLDPAEARALVCEVFDSFTSRSIQHLVHEIGQRLLSAYPHLSEVAFEARNRTPDATTPPDRPGTRIYTDARPIYGNIGLVLRR